uniref:Uncharacterized protein n=1 Tax=Medicago truncatula TaxID=3880 RepID=I3S8A0_MEDTR|nr:unknown [Medicago truncatula]
MMVKGKVLVMLIVMEEKMMVNLRDFLMEKLVKVLVMMKVKDSLCDQNSWQNLMFVEVFYCMVYPLVGQSARPQYFHENIPLQTKSMDQ